MKITAYYLKFDEIRIIADDVRVLFTKGVQTAPIDIEYIIEIALGIQLIPIQDLRSNFKVDAMLSADFNSIMIDAELYNEPWYESRRRFTLAHELGHYFLHRELKSDLVFTDPDQWINHHKGKSPDLMDWEERQANEFAGRLLVPREVLVLEIINLTEKRIKYEETLQLISKQVSNEVLLTKKREWICRQLAEKFRVCTQVIEIRLVKEKIEIY